MRWILLALAFSLLCACQLTAPAGQEMAAPKATGITGLSTDAISVTTLGSPAQTTKPAPKAAANPPPSRPEVAPPPVRIATAQTPHPKPRPTTLGQAAMKPVASPAAATPPAKPKTAEQLLCEKSGGQWAVAGTTGANLCVKPTHDGGKLCTKKGDCEGMCLARSNTCAPFAPLFGCNDVLDKDGRAVTLCID